MRVLQINSVCGTGSTGRIATDIHKLLIDSGYESTIAYSRGPALHCDNTIKIGNKLDQYVHVLDTRLFDRHGFSSCKSTDQLIRSIEDLAPDVIHLHNIHGYYLNIEKLFEFLKEYNRPVVWTLHDCWPFTGHCSYFDYVQCEKWKTGCHNCPQLHEYPQSWFRDNSKSNYERKMTAFQGVRNLTIVVPSQWLANLVSSSYLSEYLVRVIRNGINTQVFKPTDRVYRREHQLEDKFIILGVASVWSRRKGLDDFIDLSRLLKSDEQIILVGLSKKQVDNLPPNIIGITRTDNIHELADLYSSADVFVNPTYEDNYPTTNLEAISCGTKVITYNTGGSPESITDDTGYVVPKGDVQMLYYEIQQLKKEKYSIDDHGGEQIFDALLLFEEYISLYKTMYKY